MTQPPAPTKPHHTPTGFQNNYLGKVAKSGREFWRWQYQRLRDGVPQAPAVPTPVQSPDLVFVHANAHAAAMRPAITWVGHATMLVQANGLNVLLDPMFSARASPVQFIGPRRAQAPGLSIAQLPAIDVVLISHNHYDHLDKNSVLALAARAPAATLFLVPLGLKAWFTGLGIGNVKELDWWDSVVLNGTQFHLAPVQHWSARGVGDRNQTLWGGWAVLGPQLHWYFSGDAGYSQDFADTKAHFAAQQSTAQGGGFDLALIAVGAYEPRWFMREQHVNPAEAVRAHLDLGAKYSVGVHWGTFELTDEPLDQPPKDLAAARLAAGLAAETFGVMAIGETRQVAARAP